MRNLYRSMLKYITYGACCLTLVPSLLSAETKEGDVRMDVALNSDSFFGFYPTFQGGYALSEDIELTMYGILWSGGVGENWGNWTEAGFGANFQLMEGLAINPQIGFLAGSLLSSGATNEAVAGDGWVPNVTINLNKERVEGQIYAGYYDNLQDRTVNENATTLEFLHYWGNIGTKFHRNFSAGIHWESLLRTGGSNASSDDVYRWLGAYLQLSKPESKFFARVTAGPDFTEGNDSFGKAAVGYSF